MSARLLRDARRGLLGSSLDREFDERLREFPPRYAGGISGSRTDAGTGLGQAGGGGVPHGRTREPALVEPVRALHRGFQLVRACCRPVLSPWSTGALP